MLQSVLFSCVSMQLVSNVYVNKEFTFTKRETFFLEPVSISSYNFLEEEEIGYIMDQKLAFALNSSERVTLTETKAESDYTIAPELIVKVYEEKYNKRNYYLLIVRVISREKTVCQFNYEYNGTAHIFDARLQNTMVEKLLKELAKSFTRADENEP